MEGERKFRDFDKEFLLWPFEVDVGYKRDPKDPPDLSFHQLVFNYN